MTKNLKCDFINNLKSKSKSENTIQAYSRNLDLFFEFLEQQNKSVLEVKHTDIEKFLLFLFDRKYHIAKSSLYSLWNLGWPQISDPLGTTS